MGKKEAKKGEYLFFLFEESRLENKNTYESRNRIAKREKEV